MMFSLSTPTCICRKLLDLSPTCAQRKLEHEHVPRSVLAGPESDGRAPPHLRIFFLHTHDVVKGTFFSEGPPQMPCTSRAAIILIKAALHQHRNGSDAPPPLVVPWWCPDRSSDPIRILSSASSRNPSSMVQESSVYKQKPFGGAFLKRGLQL